MKKKLFLSIAVLAINGLTQAAAGYTANLTLHNETDSKALIKLPGADDFRKVGLHAQLPLWQLDPTSDDAVVVKFKGKAGYALMNKTFRIKPAMSAKWGELPKGRIELRVNSVDPLTASLEYKDAEGIWKNMELEVR